MSVITASAALLAIVMVGTKVSFDLRQLVRHSNDPTTANGIRFRKRLLFFVVPATVISAIVLAIWFLAWAASHAPSSWGDVMLAGLVGLTASLLAIAFPISGRLYNWVTLSGASLTGVRSVFLPAIYWVSECAATVFLCALAAGILGVWSVGSSLFIVIPIGVAAPPLYRALVGPLFLRTRMRAALTQLGKVPRAQDLTRLQEWADELATRHGLSASPPILLVQGRATFAAEALRAEAAIFVSEELLRAMTEVESKALIAHEFAHILRRERLRRALVSAAITVWYVSLYVWWIGRHPESAFGTRLAWLLVYSYMMQAARTVLSRRSEFAADKMAAEILGDPAPVVGAVKKIAAVWRIPLNRASATHPSPAARIAALADLS